MKRLFVIFSLLLLLTFTHAHAQDATPEAAAGWTIEQRCVGEPVRRPEGWTFDGTILMTGYQGLHGVNDDWDTPHVVVPLRVAESQIYGDLGGLGALSPNGEWYASVYGTQGREASYNPIMSVNEIRVYNTLTDEIYIVDPRTADNNYYGIFTGGSFAKIHWRNNQTIVFDNLILYPFIDEVVNNPNPEPFVVGFSYPIPSPDWSRVIERDDQGWILYDLDQQINLTRLDLASGRVVVAWWSPDSAYFLALTSQGELALFTQNGELLEIVFSEFQDNSYYAAQLPAQPVDWTSDGSMFAFTISSSASDVYIGNFSRRTLTSTCIEVGRGLVWSPDNSQIAMIDYSYSDPVVQIFDLNNWQRHSVAIHSGAILGWRAND